MRVLHGPVNVGNQPWVLSRAERALGLDSDVVTAFNTWLDYPSDRVLTGSPYKPSLRNHLVRARFGLHAAWSYDVLHYYFGQSFVHRSGTISPINFADLRLARQLGRRVFMTLQGCDVRRAGSSNRRNAVTMCKPGGCSVYSTCIASLDRVRQHLIDEVLPLCDHVFYLNPELGHDTSRGTFMPYANCDISAIVPTEPRARRRPLILHAPSDRSIKGSALIEAALNTLRSRFEFDYRTVTGVPHAEAMRLYGEADLVIDQVLAGWYGGFAVELMAMGKPVACYIRDEDIAFVPKAMQAELPILRIDPRTLETDLARILDDHAHWPDHAQASRKFAERWHDPMRIAAAMRRCYEDPGTKFEMTVPG